MIQATIVKVAKLPKCDFHAQDGQDVDATYDGKTRMGPWAFMCEDHMNKNGTGLGMGQGQKLVVVK